MKSWIKAVGLFLSMLGAAPAAAQTEAAAPSDPFRARAQELVALFNGDAKPESIFNDAFLAAVPAAQLQAIIAQVKTGAGAAQGVNRIEAKSPFSGTVYLDFERATLELQMVVEADPPHKVSGLLIRGSQQRNDSLAAVLEELRALPGTISFAAARLGNGPPTIIEAINPDRSLAIGSAFKLFILAELSRQVQAGERKWSDVAPLDRRSLPSGILQEWPEGAPLTLHTLASLMISRSDNTATDLLLHHVGRERVEALLPALGLAAPERNRPFLSTYELFVLKYGADEGLRRSFEAADEGGRRALLPRLAAVPSESIDPGRSGGKPDAIGTLEWFASAADLVRTMDWLRRHGGEEVQQILAINPGLGESLAGRFGYLGYKGGSEPGVVNMTFLARTNSGEWLAVAGSWNNEAAEVAADEFGAKMARVLSLLSGPAA